MNTERENWDRMAGDYQAVFRLGLNGYNEGLLRFWHEQGMLRPGFRVLDIGCGVGKYGTYLAELGYDVTLTDISGEMLRHAGENMAKYGVPLTLKCLIRNVDGMAFYRATGWKQIGNGNSDDGAYVLLRYDPIEGRI